MRLGWLAGASGLAIAVASGAGTARADVATDGTVGPKVRRSTQSIEVGADLGKVKGKNLFHSFQQFDIEEDQTVTFTGPGGLDNVIGRVTGGDRSDIDGTLASTVPNADLYLINPKGIVFGPNARLDVPAGFHASTADELRFEDGTAFSATSPQAPVLTVAAPQSFGFLGTQPGNITVDRGRLEVDPGNVLSLVGGDVEVRGGNDGILNAPGGQINLAAVGPAADAPIANIANTPSASGAVTVTDRGRVTATGTGGGLVLLRAGALLVEDRSLIQAGTQGDGDAAGVLVALDGDMTLRNSLIAAGSFGAGAAGAVVVTADNIAIDGGQIDATGFRTGSAGTIVIGVPEGRLTIAGTLLEDQPGALLDGQPGSDLDTELLERRPGLFTATRAQSTTPRAGIFVEAGQIELDGGLISSVTRSGATGAPLSILADEVQLANRAVLSAETFADGAGGNVTVTAPERLSVDNSFIGSNSRAGARGNAGTVTIDGGRLVFVNEGRVFNGTNSAGSGGVIRVDADSIYIDGRVVGREREFSTGITATAEEGSTGSASPGVFVTAREIDILHGGLINSGTFGSGSAGPVTVTGVDRLHVSGDGFTGGATGIVSQAERGSSGTAGAVTVMADDVELTAGGVISSSTFGSGSANTVFVNVGRLFVSGDGRTDIGTGIVSQAEASSSDNAGAGAITVVADDIELREGGLISSATSSSGAAGRVIVVANDILISSDGVTAVATGITSQANPGMTGAAGGVGVTILPGGDGIEVRGQEGVITARALGSSTAGVVVILNAPKLRIADGGAITSESQAQSAGGVFIREVGELDVDNAGIRVSSRDAEGGLIEITAQDRVSLRDAEVTTDGAQPFEGRSLITVTAPLVAINDSEVSSITDQGVLTGSGVIAIEADVALVSVDSTVQASSSLEIGGLQADLGSRLVAPETAFVDASSLLRESCAARRAGAASSFTATGKGGLPPGPDQPLATSALGDGSRLTLASGLLVGDC